MPNIITDRDAREYVIRAIEAGDAKAEEYDVEGILITLHAIAGDWDVDSINPTTFWNVVLKHALT